MKGFIKIIIFIAGAIGLVYGMVAIRPYDEILIGSTYYDAGVLWLIFLVMLILWCFIWLCVLGYTIERRDKAMSPLLTESVTVISKFHEKEVDGMAGMVSTTNSYALVFEFTDKQRKKFPVTAEQFALVREGEAGTLSYKCLKNGKLASGLLFVDFQPQP